MSYHISMTTIQVRIDDKTKKDAKKVLNELGLDMSSAIKVYLKQIAITKSIPLTLQTENGLTPEFEDLVLRSDDEATQERDVTKSLSPKQAISYLKKL